MLSYLISGILLGLSAGLAPGQTNTLIISHTLRYGPREGAKIAFAPLFTDVPIIALGVLLIGSFSNTDQVLGVLSLLGAVVLVLLGVGNLRQKPLHIDVTDEAPFSILKGVTVNVLNPHPYIFWFGVGTPLIIKAAEQSWWHALAFLLPFLICIVGAKLGIARVSGRSRKFLEGEAYIWVVRFLGVVLIVFAGFLLKDGLLLL